MKKIGKVLFASTLALLLFGCSKKTSKPTTKTNTKTNQTTQQNEETYTIKFVDSDDTLLEEVKVKKGDTPTFSKANPTKASDAYSYTFNGWDKAITAASSDTTYKATYTQTAIDFDIVYELNGGTNNDSNPSTYNITMSNISLLNPSREGYSFTGWVSEGASITTINTSSAKTINVEATWSINSYVVEINKNIGAAGTVTGEGTYEYDSEVTLTATVNTGYVFVGFYDGSNCLGTSTTTKLKMVAKKLNVEARYDYEDYNVTIENDDPSCGSVTGEGEYAYKSTVTLVATPATGYLFKGWFIDGSFRNNYTSYSFEMPNNDVNVVAKWEKAKYEITIVNQITGTTISGITSGNMYEYNSNMTLTINNASNRKFVKWSRSDSVTYVGTKYTFNVPATELTITISYLDTEYYKNGNTVYFGYYPQSLESDSTIISNLNAKVTKLPTDADNSWVCYGYYNDGGTSDYMWYIDVDLNNDGLLDYRGVYFTNYRPSYDTSAGEGNSDIDNNGFSTGNVYWFKYEVIKWIVLSTNDNKVTLVADLILDCQDFYLHKQNGKFEHNGGTGYANNYALSNIRKWLNDQFYNTAFSSAEKAIIKKTTVDNSEIKTFRGNDVSEYVCENTSDNVYLLSWKEATGVGGKNVTSYALVQGFNKNLFVWFLRSPDEGASSVQARVGSNYCDAQGWVLNGVRPAITIEL